MNKKDIHHRPPHDELGRHIGKVPYEEPAPDLVRRIMASLKPVRPGPIQRLLRWFKAPLDLKISRAAASIIVLLLLLPYGYDLYRTNRNRQQEAVANGRSMKIPVVFYYSGKEAKSVAVVGSFNRWNSKGYELRRHPETGQWSLAVDLPPGKHDYVFIVNGDQVYQDPAADLIVEDDFGQRNSVLFVKGSNGV